MRRGEYTNFPRPDLPHIPSFHRIACWCAGAPGKIYSGRGDEQTRAGFLHDDRDIEQMIKVSMCDEDSIRFWCKMFHPIINAGNVRLDSRTKSYPRKIDPRKIRIDKQRMVPN